MTPEFIESTMARSTTLGVLTAKGLVEMTVARPAGNKAVVLVGFIRGPYVKAVEKVAKSERLEIARTYVRLGYDVYETHYDPHERRSQANRLANAWPNDLYVQSNGIVVPAEGPFVELGKGGYYVFGEDFVLVSTRIEDDFRRQARDHPGFRRAFRGKRIHFVEPYVLRLKPGARIRRIGLGGHIDLTIGYIPRQRVLTIADLHYATIGSSIQAIAQRHGLKIVPTKIDPPLSFHPFVNNYFVLNPGRPEQVVIANRFEGFDRILRACGARVQAPRLPITRLPVFRGSIKCASNQAPSARLFDRLDITYRPFRSVER